jgi:ketosteroid isomerase-like protein
MSQENVEIVRRVTEVWNQGGWEAVIDEGLLHPDIEYHDDKKWPEARSAFGTSALVERFVEVMEVLGKDAEVEVEELFDCGEGRVAMIFRFRGEARASGIRHEYRWGYICRVRDGQLNYIHAYLDPQEALKAAGLSE